MDEAAYLLRTFEPRDYPEEAALDTRLNPTLPITAEEAKHWDDATTDPTLIRLKFAVEERRTGRMAGYGLISHNPGSFHPRKFLVWVAVDPDHHGRGVGRALAARIDEEARRRRAVCLWATARADDARSLRFMERYGFTPVSQAWMSVVDLDRPTAPNAPEREEALRTAGIRFTSAALEGPDGREFREKLYHLHAEAAADEPHVGEYTPVTYDQFLEFALDGPGCLADGLLLAARGSEYVGTTSLERLLAQPDTLGVGFTGVLRPYRKMGIATALKRRAFEYARSHGFRYIRTFNNSRNQRIWSINERLGFVRKMTWTTGERQVPDPADAGGASPASAGASR